MADDKLTNNDIVLLDLAGLATIINNQLHEKELAINIIPLKSFNDLKNYDERKVACNIITLEEGTHDQLSRVEGWLKSNGSVPTILIADKLTQSWRKKLNKSGLIIYFNRSQFNKHGILVVFDILFQIYPTVTKLSLSEKKYKQYFQRLKSGEVKVIYAPKSNSGYLKVTKMHLTEDNEKLIERLKKAVTIDFLTNIPNRKYFEDVLQQNISRAKRLSEHFYLCLIDVDHFKNINDTYGHSVGDQFLKMLAARLKSILRGMDIYARLGGDEFAVLLNESKTILSTSFAVERILKELRKPYHISNRKIHATVSIGIAEFSNDMTYNVLMKNADLALYQSKEKGRNQYNFFEKEIGVAQGRYHEVENALCTAIKNDEFDMLYQPIIDLQTSEVAYLEALIRWESSVLHEKVMPNEFIPVAENSGHILKITEYVLEKVCSTMRRWLDSGYKIPRVAINFSILDLLNEDFIEHFGEIVKHYHLKPEYFYTELTETTVMEHHEAIKKTIEQLKNKGFFISIDDFGTGYSSLERLRELRFDTIKIDRGFVYKMMGSTNSMQIVRAVIELSKQLGIVAIAEGVEREEEVEFLRTWGCRYAQGYYFSEPITEEKIIQFIQDHNGMKDAGTAGLPGKIYEVGNHIRSIGHDINNYLAALLGYTNIILYMLPDHTDEYNAISAIDTSINDAVDITNTLSVRIKELQKKNSSKQNNNEVILEMEKIAKQSGEALSRCAVQFEYAINPFITDIIKGRPAIKKKYKCMIEIIVNLKILNEQLIFHNAHRGNLIKYSNGQTDEK